MGFVGDAISTINTVVESAVASNFAKIANAISPVFFAAIGLYVVFIAYEIIYSQREVIMSEVTKTIMAFTVVGAFTYSAPYYAQYVVPFVMHSGQDLSSAVTGSSDVANSIDGMWESLSTTLDKFIELKLSQLDMLDIGGYIGAYSIYFIGYIGGAILIFYSAVFLVVSTLAVGIALSVGIIFICFSVFPSTRSMFTAWCGTCLNYILLSLFYTISFSFVMTMIETAMVSEDTMSLYKVVMLLLTIAVSIYLIEHVGVMCSTLTGGVGINGLTAAANGAAGKMATATGMRAAGNVAKGFMGKMARSGASKAFSSANKMRKNIIGG
ncbi:type IV secretion system protein [Escherichia coli]|nr:type IV secretion system protein [Escherichia coli]ELM7731206.1 type IV secretion system protein [Escherichia coli]ELM7764837.1 type IV secretion system protein [Escherichia coli]ELM7769621.1 type IV secretion system protein [Escherichia coli]ELM7940083.1 type IV secretion system protein [Escherichia coli]